MGTHREIFWRESVDDLHNNLAELGCELIVSDSPPAKTIKSLSDTCTIAKIYYHKAAASEEKAEESAVQQLGIATSAFQDHTLIEPSDLPFAIKNTPDLFTTFRKEVEKNLRISDPVGIPTVTTKTQVSKKKLEPSLARFRGGETAALERVKHYIWTSDRLKIYKDTRNGMLDEDDSSKFSPWLALGCVSARQIYAEVQKYERERIANDSTYWLVFELLWRDFFAFQLMKQGDSFFRQTGLQGLSLPWSTNKAHLQAWQEAQTGFTLIDAAMTELNTTGYMSNRARQNVASFFCKNLGLDWRLGAEYFETQLVDYDVASNWGNWMYQAGVGNDAREFRLFNLFKQSENYDPDGRYVKHYLKNLSGLSLNELRRPGEASRLKTGYPAPIVDFDASARVNRAAYEKAAGTDSRGSIERQQRHGRDNRRIRR
jgi:deoxyribodipyrimidine photo-lyase